MKNVNRLICIVLLIFFSLVGCIPPWKISEEAASAFVTSRNSDIGVEVQEGISTSDKNPTLCRGYFRISSGEEVHNCPSFGYYLKKLEKNGIRYYFNNGRNSLCRYSYLVVDNIVKSWRYEVEDISVCRNRIF